MHKMKIQHIREKLNLSRYELAQALDVTYSAIANYEQGLRKPSFPVCVKLISFCKKHKLKVTLKELIGYSLPDIN